MKLIIIKRTDILHIIRLNAQNIQLSLSFFSSSLFDYLMQIPPLLLFLFFFKTAIGFSQISTPNETLTHLSYDQIWAKTLTGSHFNEFWSFHFFFEEDITVHATFSAANFGSLKAPVTGLQLSVKGLNQTIYQLSREYDLPHLIQDRELGEFRLRKEREIYFQGDLPGELRVRIHTTKDGVEYDLDLLLKTSKSGLKLGDGIFRVGDEDIGFLTHVPYAEASGRIRISQTEVRVEGTAYLDHVYQYQTTTRLIDSGYRFIQHQDQDNWDLIFIMIPDHSVPDQVIGQRIRSRQGDVSSSIVRKAERRADEYLFGNRVTSELHIELSDGQIVTLRRTADHERFSVLSELNRFARAAARRFLGGEIIHFRGEAQLSDSSNKPYEGHYNFFIVR